MTDQWLSTLEVAEMFRVPEATVRHWRNTGTGPPGARLGKHVRYQLSAILKWAEDRTDDTAGPGQGTKLTRVARGVSQKPSAVRLTP